MTNHLITEILASDRRLRAMATAETHRRFASPRRRRGDATRSTIAVAEGVRPCPPSAA